MISFLRSTTVIPAVAEKTVTVDDTTFNVILSNGTVQTSHGGKVGTVDAVALETFLKAVVWQGASVQLIAKTEEEKITEIKGVL